MYIVRSPDNGYFWVWIDCSDGKEEKGYFWSTPDVLLPVGLVGGHMGKHTL